MNHAQRLATLENLLARVVERRSQPRPVQVVHAAVSVDAELRVDPTSTAATPESIGTQTTTPFGATASPGASRASRPPARLAVDDLPDLELVDSDEEGKSTSLVPSTAPPSALADGEFEIPSHAPPPRVSPPQPLELSQDADEEPLEIDHAPLATATIPPTHGPTDEFEMPRAAGSTASAASASPERYVSPALPAVTLARVIPFVRGHARTFRELLERTLNLKSRGRS